MPKNQTVNYKLWAVFAFKLSRQVKEVFMPILRNTFFCPSHNYCNSLCFSVSLLQILKEDLISPPLLSIPNMCIWNMQKVKG
jgi:hypothetical protein